MAAVFPKAQAGDARVPGVVFLYQFPGVVRGTVVHQHKAALRRDTGRERGELVEKKESGTQVIVKPVDRIILIGTKTEDTDKESNDTDLQMSADEELTLPELEAESVQTEETTDSGDVEFGITQDVSGEGISYSSLIIGTCTAYYEVDGITSTGTVPQVGTVAVNPSVIPYGTRLYICSADGSYVYGYAIAEDTGGACMAGDIVVDLYMNSEEECDAFGRQELYIYVLN